MRKARPRSLQFDSLEGRQLLSIPGVTISGTTLKITAQQSSGDVAFVEPVTNSGGTITGYYVYLDGNSETVTPSLSTIDFYGSVGSNSYANFTSLNSVFNMNGSNNAVTTGAGYNTVYWGNRFGNNNNFTYMEYAGLGTAIYEEGGTGDTLDNPYSGPVTVYS